MENKMKTLILLITCACAAQFACAYALENDVYDTTIQPVQNSFETSVQFSDATPHAPPKEERSTGNAMLYGLQRGGLNLLTCWMEIPRNISYHFTDNPMSAIITAPLFGATFTTMRAVYSVGDIITAGYTGNYQYAGMKDYVWDEKWIGPAAKEKPAETTSPSFPSTTAPTLQ